ncbi:MAG: shikimate dehydrogenase [Cyclobacteriaceae bacterium]|nr:shikimate dehydrogenase [Cyclobacteriaceae bacterium]
MLLGLIGKSLKHSFSKRYFTEKFEREKIDNYQYELFELAAIDELPSLLQTPDLIGLNVTIPYKQAVIPYLNDLSPEARRIGAVNTIQRQGDQWIGHNTDTIGFRDSLLNLLGDAKPQRGLILGNGGAALAVKVALEDLDIPYSQVSRQAGLDYTYEQLDASVLSSHHLIINTTPLGMFPEVESKPLIDYQSIGKEHFAYDLVYNPAETLFLKLAKSQGAKTLNGLPMLYGQAEAAWQIWQNTQPES